MPDHIITRAQIVAAVTAAAAGNHQAPLPGTRYTLEQTGTGFRILENGQDIAHVQVGRNARASGVSTINTNGDRRGRGLAAVLAAAAAERANIDGATHLGLSSTDTSGGFWTARGLTDGGAMPIAGAINRHYYFRPMVGAVPALPVGRAAEMAALAAPPPTSLLMSPGVAVAYGVLAAPPAAGTRFLVVRD